MSEILSGGPERPPWRPPRWLVMAAVAVVTIAALVVSLIVANGEDAPQSAKPRSSPSLSSPTGVPTPDGPNASVRQDETPGLLINGVALGQGSLNRHDRRADAGPWTVTVRRSDGSLARNGAVVTFPVSKPRVGRPIRIGDASGWNRSGEIIWPVSGADARVRGDLPRPQLVGIAAATTVSSGRPKVRAPSGFSVVSTGAARPHLLREARYGSDEVGEAGELSGGLTFTGVARCGGIEDRLYAVGTQPAGRVRGKPAVVTSGLVGNAVLAWEPEPGVVAYVGYSGAPLDRGAIGALRRLAERTRLLSSRQWQETRPATVDQVNDFG
ncbi:hypothetical protein RFN58_34925 [Streptomyces iakyrus]|uniref:hypothetical protein n=1 Tax=Streptomyces iakyrus TaxID=68219 RepID=UPI0012FEED35|nr:hypothetical protein [Streptomyces iakyrus]